MASTSSALGGRKITNPTPESPSHEEFIEYLKSLSSTSSQVKYKKTGGRIKCQDGFNVSVVCGTNLRSQEDSDGKWKDFELGFPSEEEPLLMDFIDNENDDLTNTVYNYVPFEILMKVVVKHGGLMIV